MPPDPPERTSSPKVTPLEKTDTTQTIAKLAEDSFPALLSLVRSGFARMSAARDRELGLPTVSIGSDGADPPDERHLHPVAFISDDDKTVISTGDEFTYGDRTAKLLGHDGTTYALIDNSGESAGTSGPKPESVKIVGSIRVGDKTYYVGDDEKPYVKKGDKNELVRATGVEVVQIESLPVSIDASELSETPAASGKEGKTEKTEGKKLKFGDSIDLDGKPAKLLAYDASGERLLIERPKVDGAKSEVIEVSPPDLTSKFTPIDHDGNTYLVDEKGNVYQDIGTRKSFTKLELVPHLKAVKSADLKKLKLTLPDVPFVAPTEVTPAWETVTHKDSVKGKDIEVVADSPYHRTYKFNGKETKLKFVNHWYHREGFVDKEGREIKKHGDVKLHITTTGTAADMRDMQAVLIPALEEACKPGGPLEGKLHSYKTHDPMIAFDENWTEKLPEFKGVPKEQHFRPGPREQVAKGFTLYPTTEADAQAVHDFCVKTLRDAGLALSEAPKTGNVGDYCTDKTTNRVTLERDMFEHSRGSQKGAVVPEALAKGIKDYCERKAKSGAKGWEAFKSSADLYRDGRLKPEALKQVLIDHKIDPTICTLFYEGGENGRLIFSSEDGGSATHVTEPGEKRYYLSESGEKVVREPKVHGETGELLQGRTGRPAFYALSFGIGEFLERDLDPAKLALQEAERKAVQRTEKVSNALARLAGDDKAFQKELRDKIKELLKGAPEGKEVDHLLEKLSDHALKKATEEDNANWRKIYRELDGKNTDDLKKKLGISDVEDKDVKERLEMVINRMEAEEKAREALAGLRIVNPLVQLDLQELARKGISAERLLDTIKQVREKARSTTISGVSADLPLEQARDIATILLSEKMEPTPENIAKAEQKRQQVEQLRKQYTDSEIPTTHALDLLTMISRNNDIFKDAFSNPEFIATTAQALAEAVLKPGSDFDKETEPAKKAEHLRKALVDILKDQLNLSPEEVPELLSKLKIEAVREGSTVRLSNGTDGPVIQIPQELLTRDPAAAVREALGKASGIALFGVLKMPGNLTYVQQALKPIIDLVVARAGPEIRARQATLLEQAGKPKPAVASETKPDTLGRPEPVTVVWEGGDTIKWGKDQKLQLSKESEELHRRKQRELAELKEELAQLERDKERNSEKIKAMKQVIATAEEHVAVLHNLNEALAGNYSDKAKEQAQAMVKDAIERALNGKSEDPLGHAKPGPLSRTTAISLVLITLATAFATKHGLGREGRRFSATFGGT